MSYLKIYEKDLDDNVKLAIISAKVSTPNVDKVLNTAVHSYVDGFQHNQFIEIYLDNPYLRVILRGDVDKLAKYSKDFDFNEAIS